MDKRLDDFKRLSKPVWKIINEKWQKYMPELEEK